MIKITGKVIYYTSVNVPVMFIEVVSSSDIISSTIFLSLVSMVKPISIV